MIALGIDPGLTAGGFAVVEQQGSHHALLASKTLRTRAGEPLHHRLARVYAAADRLIHQFRPELVGIEEQSGTLLAQLRQQRSNAKALYALRAAQAAACAAYAHGLPVVELQPRQVKRAVAVPGTGTKAQVISAVRRLCGVRPGSRFSSHAADAAAMGFGAIRVYRSSRDGLAASKGGASCAIG